MYTDTAFVYIVHRKTRDNLSEETICSWQFGFTCALVGLLWNRARERREIV